MKGILLGKKEGNTAESQKPFILWLIGCALAESLTILAGNKEKTGTVMERKQENFKEMLAFGEEGEHEVADFLIKKGVTVLPLYQFEKEHAPYLISKNGNITSPDLICFKEDAFMVEVKTKRQWVEYNGRVETGFNMKHYRHYKEIKTMTGKPVYVFFNHKEQEPTGIFFTELDKHTRIWDGKFNGVKKYEPLIFYDINVLKRVCNSK